MSNNITLGDEKEESVLTITWNNGFLSVVAAHTHPGGATAALAHVAAKAITELMTAYNVEKTKTH